MAVAGVKKKEPRTIVAMKGRPKRAKGCFARSARYLAGMVPLYELERKRLAGKTAILCACSWRVCPDAQCWFWFCVSAKTVDVNKSGDYLVADHAAPSLVGFLAPRIGSI